MVGWNGTTRMFDPGADLDLRRKRRADELDQLVQRARALPERDRLLIEALFRDGKRGPQVAALMGLPVRAVRNHARRLVDRLRSPRFIYVLRHQSHWPETRRKVANAVVIRGLSNRLAASELNLSLHVVRRQMVAIHALHDAHAAQTTSRAGGVA